MGKENSMSLHATSDKPFRLAFFDSVALADQAVRELLTAGFAKEELAIICPPQFQDHFAADVPRAEQQGSHAAEAILEGGAVGAVLGGIALAAAAFTTAGLALIPAAGVLIGGGALAGGFAGLVLREGYGEEIDQYYEEAIRVGRIVVGVHVEGEESAARLAKAKVVLAAAGGHELVSRDQPLAAGHG
jgi:hypothetical protein